MVKDPRILAILSNSRLCLPSRLLFRSLIIVNDKGRYHSLLLQNWVVKYQSVFKAFERLDRGLSLF